LSSRARSSAKKQELARLEIAFNQSAYAQVNRNDYPMLKERILNAYLLRSATQYVREFKKNREDKNTMFAVQQLAAAMSDLASSSKDNKKKIVYQDLSLFGAEYYQQMVDIREGNVPDAEFISFGIDELDKTSGVGMAPGTMTLFCGDVGGFKSTMMMNVGLHTWWKQNYNVLYVPLEMPRNLVYNKMLSRQTQIVFDAIQNPKALSEGQMDKLKKYMLEDAVAHESKMYILDSYEERTSVNLIRRMIERNLEIFKPRVVIVDYIANLTPDRKSDRPDMEIGEMLKDLRYMGRPGVVHDEGFGIVSGAQIGREGLKRVRRDGGDKMQFFSEDLRGSHDYSADADTIYAQFPDPQQPDERLQVFVVKARYGKKTFPDGNRKAVLEVQPGISLIRSSNDYYSGADKSEVLKKAAMDDDLDFGTTAKKSENPTMDSTFDDTFGTPEPVAAGAAKKTDDMDFSF
jgi:replicative DNA helicase